MGEPRLARAFAAATADTRRRTMHAAALSSKISTSALRLAPARRANDAQPRTAVIECAHKKGTGSVKNGRDGNAKYLGVKKYGEEKVTTGCIIVRQRGNKVRTSRGSSRADRRAWAWM